MGPTGATGSAPQGPAGPVGPTGTPGQQGPDALVLAPVSTAMNNGSGTDLLTFEGLTDGLRYMVILNAVAPPQGYPIQTLSCTVTSAPPYGGNVSCSTIPAYGVAAMSSNVAINGITGFGSPTQGTLAVSVQCKAALGDPLSTTMGTPQIKSGIAIPIVGNPVLAPVGTGSTLCTQDSP